MVQRIFHAFGDDEIGEEEISEFLSRTKKFYEAANNAQVNIKEVSIDGIKRISSIEKAISDIVAVLDETDPLTIIMAFAGDPVSVIKPFIEVIDAIEAEVNKAKSQVVAKLEAIGMNADSRNENNRYEEEVKCISSCKEIIERMANV